MTPTIAALLVLALILATTGIGLALQHRGAKVRADGRGGARSQ
ncbi:hypothetical protein [Rarobacter incanus]|nr:hypothetical protein [Rarobacter incanus]